MIKRAQDDFNGLDILVNNVGIQFVSPIQDFPEEKWDAIMDVCLNSAFHSTKAALPYMLEQKWGRIINTGSMHAKVASPYKSAYNAAKHGIAGLTKTVGLEVAQKGNITCNCICPGYVLTDLIKNQLKDTAKARGIPEVRATVIGLGPSCQVHTAYVSQTAAVNSGVNSPMCKHRELPACTCMHQAMCMYCFKQCVHD